MKLWLDDERAAPEGWRHVTDANEAIRLLAAGGVTHISLDNDLGEGKPEGYQVAKWIELGACLGTLDRLNMAAHSMNPVARKNIESALRNADKFWRQREQKNSTQEI